MRDNTIERRLSDLSHLVGNTPLLDIEFAFEWRICVRFQEGDAYDVEVCDYH